MNEKTRFLSILLTVSFSLFIISCGVTMTNGENWLSSKTDKPEMDVSGTWSSPEWGSATLKQEGNRITGMLGDYPVKGVASGNRLYLVMYSGDRVHYFAELKATEKDAFKGLYTAKYATMEEVRKASAFTREMSLTKVAPQ